MSHQVMLSYNRKDEPFVRTFHEKLVEQDITTWVDWKDIKPGFPWRQALYDGVLESDLMIAFLSPNYVASGMCRMECFLAQAYRKIIIPVMIQDAWDDMDAHFETKSLANLNTVLMLQTSDTPTIDADKFSQAIQVIHQGHTPVEDEAVYISYAKNQGDFAQRILTDLQAADIPVWMDTLMEIGTDWQQALWGVLRSARAMIIIVEDGSAGSFVVQKEVLLARTRQIPIFPIIPPEIEPNSDIERELRHKLDATYEMRLISETQWLRPVPDHETMMTHLISALRPLFEQTEPTP